MSDCVESYISSYDELKAVLAWMKYMKVFTSDPEPCTTAEEWALYFLKKFLEPGLKTRTSLFLNRMCLSVFSFFGLDEKLCGIVAGYLPFDFQTVELDYRTDEVSRTPVFYESWFTFLIETRLGGEVLSKTSITFSTAFPINTKVEVVSGHYGAVEDFEDPDAIENIAKMSLAEVAESFFE